ncbi:type II toxin-antitoxin system PemK/MazF family toxin [uncultured Brachybacterium sp.]|uniref:type II toxin-antitoxin system PemK/MazF family toxin n=1 Tax=uncultured Brachybacterium sp. TaxID=189680 RepID=UPI00263632A6|nr:type II toxin-antitoxin system PemK/MazF family toxin [uncultured Brachybacterium sp.]
MSLVSRLTSLLRSAARSPAVRRGARSLSRAAVQAVKEQRSDTSGHGAGRAAGKAAGRAAAGADSARALADRRGATPLTLEYAPRQDGHPDPGEVVWAWVPYEEDLSQGKDRPVLVIAEEPAATGGSDGTGEVLVALMLTSRDRADVGEVTTDQHGATWVDIGSGEWDREGRASEVRADRLLRLAPGEVRRAGGRLDRARYDRVSAAVRTVHGWR